MTDKRGYEVIRDPLLNKGTAFSEEEREALGLHGLLPRQINSMTQQAQRAYAGVEAAATPLTKYVALAALQDRNEHLFYKVLMNNLETLMPIVYTPTVGLATQNFSQVFQRGRGLWITPDYRGRIAEVLQNAVAGRDIKLIVITDNESILGIGDQGAGGMAISIGKLALYVAGAGIPPSQTLPISLDVGTNNRDLLNDELYLGWPHERLRGEAYDSLVDEFVAAVESVIPGALVQWEDFRKDNALAILNRHRDTCLSFNDDIQGTGAVALAGVLSGLRVTGGQLVEQRIAIHGAGAAGLGIARQIHAALMQQGLTAEQAVERVAVLDSRGLLVRDREFADEYKTELAWPVATAEAHGLGDAQARNLAEVVAAYRPTVLIGTSGQAGAFSEDIVKTMAAAVDQPIILPFSNPTDRAEATPTDLLRWTDGAALVATGSPFAPVQHGNRTVEVGQGNNVFIFPGLGLGALATRSRSVTDNMVSTASAALAGALTEGELARGLLFPAVDRLRQVSAEVARAVAEQAVSDGVAANPMDEQTIADMWQPEYPSYA